MRLKTLRKTCTEKIMAMHDSMILSYFEFATDLPLEEIQGMKLQMEQGVNPRDIKAKLAATIVGMFHSPEAAGAAASHFNRLFREGDVPEDMDEVKLAGEVNIVDVLVDTGLASSKTEARRFVEQKAIKIDGTPVTSLETNVKGTSDGVVLQRGKRRFVKLVS